MRWFVWLLAAFSVACTQSPYPKIKDAWIAEAPPQAPVMAAYLTLENPSREEWQLEMIQAEDFAIVQIHDMGMKDGLMRMRHQDSISLEAGQTIKLHPGGMHLMLMQGKKTLKLGDSSAIDFHFTSAQAEHVIRLTPTVEARKD